MTAGDRLCAATGVLAACLANLVPARHQMRYIVATARVASRSCIRPATVPELQRLMWAIHALSAWWPGRFACLERSHAAVIAAWLRGSRTELRIGMATGPLRRHAWPEAGGVPVVRPGELRVTGVFAPMR